ncbi:phosphoribosyltransferase-like protein, partial [Providencia heimbachae]
MKPSDKPKLKQLSIEKIETSYEITQWLTQFSDSEQSFAKLILSKLIFVSRDEYTKWLLKAISSLPNNHKYALFSVRKLPKENHILWDSQGEIVDRPGCSLGSEDLVYSIISNLVRSNKDFLIEHPSLNELKRHKIHNYILIDDAIGSGDRVSEFINAMLSNPTFLSWWSLGIIKFTLLSFARTQGS